MLLAHQLGVGRIRGDQGRQEQYMLHSRVIGKTSHNATSNMTSPSIHFSKVHKLSPVHLAKTTLSNWS